MNFAQLYITMISKETEVAHNYFFIFAIVLHIFSFCTIVEGGGGVEFAVISIVGSDVEADFLLKGSDVIYDMCKRNREKWGGGRVCSPQTNDIMSFWSKYSYFPFLVDPCKRCIGFMGTKDID